MNNVRRVLSTRLLIQPIIRQRVAASMPAAALNVCRSNNASSKRSYGSHAEKPPTDEEV
jgi:hypothetical protein